MNRKTGKGIRFERITLKGDTPKQNKEGIAVIRDGRQVAMLPEADRLRRALNQPLDEIEYIAHNLSEILKREPTINELEFWKAVLDFRRAQESHEEE